MVIRQSMTLTGHVGPCYVVDRLLFMQLCSLEISIESDACNTAESAAVVFLVYSADIAANDCFSASVSRATRATSSSR